MRCAGARRVQAHAALCSGPALRGVWLCGLVVKRDVILHVLPACCRRAAGMVHARL